VIETLVARTERLVETQQSMIRIVGLSATLPNYLDAADFLKVNRHKGLFYFDNKFRPVPLQQSFIGVKSKNRFQQMNQMDEAAYEVVSKALAGGHQCMVRSSFHLQSSLSAVVFGGVWPCLRSCVS
jgi:activating signal cointegrator complex subunit 3